MRVIKTIREHKGLTQMELANLSGLSRNTIINFESGRRSPRIVDLEKISQVLDVKIKDFLINPTQQVQEKKTA